MKCPVCRAELDQGRQCRRCKADLSLLFELEDRRREVLGAARRHLLRGEYDRALEATRVGEALRRSEDSRRLRALCLLLKRDFPGAWEAYRRVERQGAES